jgi:hypothetical protein
MNEDKSVIAKLAEIIDIEPLDVVNDARDYGLNVYEVEDFSKQPHNYVFIEKLMNKYATLAASYSAASGASSGIGGVATTVALAGADISNMAAQLYRLNQKCAVLNGYDINNPIHTEQTQLIYLKALGFDAAAMTAIRSQMAKAAAEQISKKGPASSLVIRLIMLVAKQLGVTITKQQAVKLVPLIGGVLGAGVNYQFVQSASRTMITEYKLDYFDRWQIRN